MFGMGKRNMTHAFDAYAKMHSLQFKPGSDEILFTAKFLKTSFYNESRETNTVAPYAMLDTVTPPFNSAERQTAKKNGMDNPNINIVMYGGKTIHCVNDFLETYEIEPEKLDTVGKVTPTVARPPIIKSIPMPSAAHPVKEPGTNNLINFYITMSIMPFLPSKLNVMRIKSSTETETITTISVDQIPYMHSLGVTEDYAVLLAHPLYLDMMAMGLSDEPAIDNMKWKPENPTNVYVVNLKTGHTTHLKAPARFFMHNINTYQAGKDKIIMDMTSYSSFNIMHLSVLDNLRNPDFVWPKEDLPHLKRVVIDLKAGQVELQDVPSLPSMEFINTLELPVINRNHASKSYCFAYGEAFGPEGLSDTRLVKKDFCNKGQGDKVWSIPGHVPSEPWFEANPSGTREDDGIVFSIVLNGNTGKSYLIFLDGQTFKPVNYADLPTWVPMSLHGQLFN